MNSVFVYYHDGYHDNGDVGYIEFAGDETLSHSEDIKQSALKKAQDFIAERMAAKGTDATIHNYDVIYGKKLNITIVDVVKKIILK